MLESTVERERRVFERVLVRCPVRYKTDRENVLAEGSAKDLSDGGLGLFSRSKLEQYKQLEMWVKLSPQIKPLHIAGKVVWAEKRRPDLWRAGICFNHRAFIEIVKIVVSKKEVIEDV